MKHAFFLFLLMIAAWAAWRLAPNATRKHALLLTIKELSAIAAIALFLMGLVVLAFNLTSIKVL